MISLILTTMACNDTTTTQADGYTPEIPVLKSDRMTPDILWSFGRLGGAQLSPDATEILYPVTYFNKEENKGYTDLYIVNISSGESRRITNTKENEAEARWDISGEKIWFMTGGQLWQMDKDGSNRKQISKVDGGIEGYLFSPDETKLAFIKNVKLEPTVQTMHPDLPKADARIIDNQFYRHWNDWVDGYSHIFITDFTKGKDVTTGVDILEGEKWEAPVRPFGGVEQMTWTADGENIIYTSRKKEGLEYAESTNTDLYRYNVGSGNTINLTEGMMGYDKNPVISPNGQYMAWESMERDGYEADKTRLYIMNLVNGEKEDFSLGFDQEASGLQWADDENIYFISCIKGTHQIYRLNLVSMNIDQVTEGAHDYTAVIPVGNKLVASKMSMSKPSELYIVDAETGSDKPLTQINEKLLSQLTMGKAEERWVKTTDGKDMLVWVVYPPHFDPNKKYPAILYCQGGPQSAVSQFWSYRWNFQNIVANDYILVAPNRRGLPGFGQEWLEQISGDYSGQNIKDYLSAIDNVKQEPYVDAENLGCVGASYGGYSVYYLAGHHDKRFKAFIAHCGIFDLEQQYFQTEEMWFANWDMGGAPWEKDNKVAQRTFANSPHRFVGNWDAPILVIHGQKDFRIDAAQGMGAFNAARMRGIPARYLYYPEECHWVTGCQNGILWQRTFVGWLDQWLKQENK
ncbi:MAG: S9 family peptidase [Marinifilaceae bacterium]